MTTKLYNFNDLWSVCHSDCKTIANNTLALRECDTLSPEGGLSHYVSILLHGNKILTLESYRDGSQILLHIRPDSYKWFTFLTTTRINQVIMSYGYKCHRDMTNQVYEVTTSPDRLGHRFTHIIYPDNYPLILNPHYPDDWSQSPSRGFTGHYDYEVTLD